jgi:hypothetical protein
MVFRAGHLLGLKPRMDTGAAPAGMGAMKTWSQIATARWT